MGAQIRQQSSRAPGFAAAVRVSWNPTYFQGTYFGQKEKGEIHEMTGRQWGAEMKGLDLLSRNLGNSLNS